MRKTESNKVGIFTSLSPGKILLPPLCTLTKTPKKFFNGSFSANFATGAHNSAETKSLKFLLGEPPPNWNGKKNLKRGAWHCRGFFGWVRSVCRWWWWWSVKLEEEKKNPKFVPPPKTVDFPFLLLLLYSHDGGEGKWEWEWNHVHTCCATRKVQIQSV